MPVLMFPCRTYIQVPSSIFALQAPSAPATDAQQPRPAAVPTSLLELQRVEAEAEAQRLYGPCGNDYVKLSAGLDYLEVGP